MATKTRTRSPLRMVVVSAVAAGVAVGSYGIASAATGNGSSSTAATQSTAVATAAAPAVTLTAQTPPANGQAGAPQGQPPGATAGNPWGNQRSDETLLTGDVAAAVKKAALAKVDGGTIVRVETDADGHAAYEAHMLDKSGNPITVYVDKSYTVVSTESR